MNEETEQVPALISPVMTAGDKAEFASYIKGESATPPACVTKVMTSIANKLTMVAGCDMVSSINREQNLDAFMAAAEARLFDPAAIEDMPREELQETYEKAAKRKDILAESRRKFLAQNRDALSVQGSEQEKLLAQIMTMSPEQVEKLKVAVASIAAEVVETPDQTSPEAVEENL